MKDTRRPTRGSERGDESLPKIGGDSIPPEAGRPGNAGPVEPVDAATVVLVRTGRAGRAESAGLEVLLRRRPHTMAFAPGRHVFPGGSVHPDDADPRVVARSRLSPPEASRRLAGGMSQERAIAFHIAALRELFEETGLLLVDPAPFVDPSGRAEVVAGRKRFVELVDGLASGSDQILRTDLLVPIARWVTPRFLERRFDTWFFAAAVELATELSFDPREVAEGVWLRPPDALDEMAAGRMLLWLPTSTTLLRLASLGDVSGLPDMAAGSPWPPRIDRPGADVIRLRSGSAGGVPGREAASYLVGRRELIVVDPGDPTEDSLDALRSRVDEIGGAVRAIVVTSADPDRTGGCEALRGALGLPVLGPPGAGRFLPFEVAALADGQRVPFVDVAVSVHASPVTGSVIEGSRISLIVGDTILGDDPGG